MNTKTILKRLFTITLCSLIIVSTQIDRLNVNASTYVTSFESITGSTGRGAAKISWNNNGNNVYKVYKSTDGSKYETVGVNFEEISRVRVLQIYPHPSAQYQLKTWMESNGYGKGLLSVDSVWWDSFMSNPWAYLTTDGSSTNGNWKYDVIFFGTWDSNNGKEFNTAGMNATISFIRAGRGCIIGHDIICDSDGRGYYHGAGNNFNTNALAPYFGLTSPNRAWANGRGSTSTQVQITKTGLFTTYPWTIGGTGTVLNIPTAHNVGQHVGNGTIWLKFYGSSVDTTSGYGANSNFYLETYNNCAMIMTGHSSGQATADEQKIIANLIFFSVQLHSNSPVTDNSAMDYAAPNVPIINVLSQNDTGVDVDVTAADNGSQYYYKIEEFNKNDTTRPISTAQTSGRVTSGIKGYRYVVNTNANTTVTVNNASTNKNIHIDRTNGVQYLHVAAVDGAGNISGTTHYKILSKDVHAPIISSVGEYTLQINAADDSSNQTNELVSGIKGYCVTNSAVKPAADKFEPSVNLKSLRSGTNYVWAMDNAGNISAPYKTFVHSDLFYEGVEVNRVYYNGTEVNEYMFEGNKIFF